MSAREYWTVLREDRWLVAGIVLLCLLGALLLDLFLPRTYTSTAVFYVASPQVEASSTDAYSGTQLSTERVKSYTELLQGPRVARDASLLLGGDPTAGEIQAAVSASSVTETVVLTLEVTERSPEQARLVADAVATAFTRLVASVESTGAAVDRPIATAEIILRPTAPEEPSGPQTTILFGVALLVGIVVGVGVALARRALRDAVDTPETLAERLGAPVLGSVPALRRPPEHPALLSEPPPSATGRRARRLRARAESYRRARAALRSVAGERRCVVLTGTGPDQGTSTTAIDVAVVLAASGDSVVLVEADLRAPGVGDALALEGAPGLRDVLEHGADVDAVVQRWSRGGIDVITAGSAGSRPSELLVGPGLGALLATLRDRYDHVLVDTPPVTDAADAIDVARHADGVVLVCRRGRTRPADIDVAASALRLAGAVVLGAILTWAVDVRDAPGAGRRPVLALPSRSPGADAAPTAAPVAEPAPAVDGTPAPEPATPSRAAGESGWGTEPPKVRVRSRTTGSSTANGGGEAPATPQRAPAKRWKAKRKEAGATHDDAVTSDAATESPATRGGDGAVNGSRVSGARVNGARTNGHAASNGSAASTGAPTD